MSCLVTVVVAFVLGSWIIFQGIPVVDYAGFIIFDYVHYSSNENVTPLLAIFP